MNPKILFTLITDDYPPQKGGVARYLSSLVEAAKGQIRVVLPLDSEYKEKNSGIYKTQVLKSKFKWSLWPKWLPLIKRCMEAEDTVLLISHVLPIGTAAYLSKIFGGPDYIVIFHGTDLVRIKTRWKKFLLKRITSNAKLLVANSRATNKILKRLLPNTTSLIITPGVSIYAAKYKQDSRRKLDIAPEEFVILSVARLVDRKGLDTLIQAVAQSDLVDKNYKLVIIGNGPQQKILENLAVINHVKLLLVQNASDDEVRKWYHAADVFCLPAREQADDVEGFGIVFLEAAMAGLPVIAGDSWGTSEAVVDKVTGLLVPPDVKNVASAINELFNDHVKRKMMGIEGILRASRDFKWEDRWSFLKDALQNIDLKVKTANTKFKIQDKESNISIVIPCWNHAKELTDTLGSLVEQTLKPAQVIVVDDGSVDHPELVTEKFLNLLNIEIIRLDKNSGAPVARNTGAEKALGEFIMFLDADAKLVPQALEKLVTALRLNPNKAYAYGDFLWGKRLFKAKEFNPDQLKSQNYIHTSALIRREQAIDFDESLSKFQDWDLWLSMLEQGKHGVWVPEVLFHITERKQGISYWLPSFAYKIPWPIFGWTPRAIIRYRKAEEVIIKKHHLDNDQ